MCAELGALGSIAIPSASDGLRLARGTGGRDKRSKKRNQLRKKPYANWWYIHPSQIWTGGSLVKALQGGGGQNSKGLPR